MRKTHSKSQLTNRKNKSTATFVESKKGSKTLKGSSCVKVTLQNTEQNSTQHMPIQAQKTASLSLSQKLISRMPGQVCYVDKQPASLKQSSRNLKGRSALEASRSYEGHAEEARKLKGRNEELLRDNTLLKEKCSDLQETSLRDKEKIKNLIIRINEVKNSQGRSGSKTLHPSTGHLPTYPQSSSNSYALLPHKKQLETPYKGVLSCESQECNQRKKYLENELYQERILRDKLQLQKREWQRNRNLLKNQYNELLSEIRQIRSDDN